MAKRKKKIDPDQILTPPGFDDVLVPNNSDSDSDSDSDSVSDSVSGVDSHEDSITDSLPRPLPQVVHEDVPDSMKMSIAATSIQAELSERYNDEFIALLRKLAYEISVVGLPISEACIYVGVDYDRLVSMMSMDPTIERLIKTKEIEYKRNLMVPISEKAKTDEKVSQWLLQGRYPDEFNPRKGSARGGGDGDDMIAVAMEFIQRSGDNTPLVTEKSGKAFIVKRTQAQNDEVRESINSILK
jgi:hypothetical protein